MTVTQIMSNSLRPHGLYSPWNSPGQNTGVSSLSLLQGILPTQESNPGLPHPVSAAQLCRRDQRVEERLLGSSPAPPPWKRLCSLLLRTLTMPRIYWEPGWRSICFCLFIQQGNFTQEKMHVSQFSSVAQSCPTLGDPIDCSTLGFPVHHQLPEFTQTHVRRVSDAIQPSHPLSSVWRCTWSMVKKRNAY